MPKVSVIIPIYNVAPYLRQCLDSVVSQTLHLYAVWTADQSTYTVRFNKNDGSGATANQTFKVGETKSLLWKDSELKWSRSGYTFKGWAESASGRCEVRERREDEKPRNGRRHEAPLRHLVPRGLKVVARGGIMV